MKPCKIAFISLGCDKNRVNLEQMMSLVQDAGHSITWEPEGADVCVINTCGFIDAAKEEAIAHILEMAKLKEAGKLKKLLVTGCLSQRYRAEIKESLPEVDGLLGTGSYTDIVGAIEELMSQQRPEHFGDIHHTDDDGLRILTTEPYLAYLKIAEGCDNWCAFCAIPAIRGRYRSRSMESLLEEARYLSEQGVQELILIAQDVTRYGTDRYGRHALPELLRALCRLEFHWIRLHYLYPSDLTDEMIEVMATEPKIVHYFDVPLQHCNDELLSVMHRRGTKAELIAKLDAIRSRIPDAVFRTSLITGLPGRMRRSSRSCATFCESRSWSGPGCSSTPRRRAPVPRPCPIRWTRRPPPTGWSCSSTCRARSWTSTTSPGWARRWRCWWRALTRRWAAGGAAATPTPRTSTATSTSPPPDASRRAALSWSV